MVNRSYQAHPVRQTTSPEIPWLAGVSEEPGPDVFWDWGPADDYVAQTSEVGVFKLQDLKLGSRKIGGNHRTVSAASRRSSSYAVHSPNRSKRLLRIRKMVPVHHKLARKVRRTLVQLRSNPYRKYRKCRNRTRTA